MKLHCELWRAVVIPGVIVATAAPGDHLEAGTLAPSNHVSAAQPAPPLAQSQPANKPSPLTGSAPVQSNGEAGSSNAPAVWPREVRSPSLLWLATQGTWEARQSLGTKLTLWAMPWLKFPVDTGFASDMAANWSWVADPFGDCAMAGFSVSSGSAGGMGQEEEAEPLPFFQQLGVISDWRKLPSFGFRLVSLETKEDGKQFVMPPFSDPNDPNFSDPFWLDKVLAQTQSEGYPDVKFSSTIVTPSPQDLLFTINPFDPGGYWLGTLGPASVPEPAVPAILVLGALACHSYRRRIAWGHHHAAGTSLFPPRTVASLT